MPTRNPHAFRSRTLGLVLVVGLAVAACDNRDEATLAIQQARVDLMGVSLPRTPVGETDPALAELQRIVTDLRTASAQASGGQKAAVSLLMAQAELALADRRAALASQVEGQGLLAMAPMRTTLDTMLARGSSSDAALAFNAEQEVTRLEAALVSKEAEIAQRQRDRAEVEDDLLLLRQGAKERLDLAAARRDEAARMALEAMALSTSESARVLGQVHQIRREAAAIEVDGATLRARADIRQPDLTECELLLGQVESQKAELESSLRAVRAQVTAARASAAEHASAAQAASDALDQMLEAALSAREDADVRIAAAIEAYEAALTSARASGEDGIAIVGASAQGRGDMHWLRAQNTGQLIELLVHASGAGVPAALDAGAQQALRERFASYAARADALRTAQRDALAAAAEAYGEARDAFQRVDATDDASRARVNRLAQLMHLCRRGASGQAIDLSTINNEPGDFTEEASDPAQEDPMPVEPDGGIGDTPEGETPQGDAGTASEPG